MFGQKTTFFPPQNVPGLDHFSWWNQSISLVLWDWRDPHRGAFQPKSMCVSQLPYKPLQKVCALRKSPLSSQPCALGVVGRKTGLLHVWWGLPAWKAHHKGAHSWPHAATDWSGSSFVAGTEGASTWSTWASPCKALHCFLLLSTSQELTLQRQTL